MTMQKVMWGAVVVVVAATMLPTAVMAQTVPSNEAIRQAIAEGLKSKGAFHGLQLQEGGKTFMRGMEALSGDNGTASSTGFRVHIYTPITWIRQLASDAAKEFRPFTVEDVREEDKAPILRVVVYPDQARTVTAKGVAGTSSVQHVVLRDSAKKTVIQPTSKDAFSEVSKNAMGGAEQYEGIRVEFPLDGLRELRGEKGDGEFILTVVGQTRNERNFEIKKKHFERMP